MRNLFDTHNHCQFSFDGKRTTVESSARSAYEKRLAGICFTDHYDFFVPEDDPEIETIKPQTLDIQGQQAEIDRVQRLYDDGFKVLKGIEIGMSEESREQTRQILTGNSFDQIIASIHYLEKSDPYYGGYFRGKDCRQAYGTYLETLLPEKWDEMDLYRRQEYLRGDDPVKAQGILKRTCVSNMEIWCECYGRRKEDMQPKDSYAISAIMKHFPAWKRAGTKVLPLYGKQRVYERNEPSESKENNS